jgi:hypothetical protein
MEKKSYTPENLELLEKYLWSKIKFSNAETLAKELDVQSVRCMDIKDDYWNTIRFYSIKKTDESVELIKFEEELTLDGKIKPKSLGKPYIFNVWDTLIVRDWTLKAERKITGFGNEFFKTEFFQKNGRKVISNINYGKILLKLLKWDCEIKKKSKLIMNIKNK